MPILARSMAPGVKPHSSFSVFCVCVSRYLKISWAIRIGSIRRSSNSVLNDFTIEGRCYSVAPLAVADVTMDL